MSKQNIHLSLPPQYNSNVNLYPHQVEHVEKIWSSFMERGEMCYIDTSRTGLGKTHIALEIASRLQSIYGIRLGIIAPNKQSLYNDDGWVKWADRYGLIVEKATTYSSIRGRGLTISNGWLYKNSTNRKEGYHATNKFEAIARAGIFLIFDEFHMATRDSSTHYACAALVRACVRNSARCRIGLLSLTPGDKTEHYPQIMRLCGLVQSIQLLKYIPSTRDYEWEEHGLGDMIRSCVIRNANRDEMVRELSDISLSRAKWLIGVFYRRNIRERICFSMPIPPNQYKIVMRNCHINCHKQDIKNLNNAIGRLCDGVQWDGYDVAEKKEWNLGQINIALRLIEMYKLRSIARYIRDRNKQEPNVKFVIAMGSRNTEHFEMFAQMLGAMEVTVPLETELLLKMARRDRSNVWSSVNGDVYKLIMHQVYRPPIDIMNGQTKIGERIKILRRFQAKHSDSWCLLLSPGVGDESISLHDVHGNHPRELIIIPDHYHSRMAQLSGRTNRIGAKSDVKVSIIYCKGTRPETSILHSMARKTKVAGEMLAKDQEHRFPGDFDVWTEEDPK